MKLTGLITEFNPFHYGHEHYVKEAKKISDASHLVAVMSPNFVQRGEPALVDKWYRAKMATLSGVDLVIELPTIFAVQSADRFAKASVDILASIPVNSLVFGSESGNIEELEQTACILKKSSIKDILYSEMKKGHSFPRAREIAVSSYQGNISLKNISQSNNILAISYLSHLHSHKKGIIPYTISRIGADYRSLKLEKIASASGIRHGVFKDSLSSVASFMPTYSYSLLENFFERYQKFHKLSYFEPLIRHHFITNSLKKAKEIIDYEDGLENRIITCFQKGLSLEDTISAIQCKRYTKTRIQRFLLHGALNITKKQYDLYSNLPVEYIRVLSIGEKGEEVLKYIKSSSDLKIITQFKRGIKELSPIQQQLFQLEVDYTNIYYNQIQAYYEINSEYTKNPHNFLKFI